MFETLNWYLQSNTGVMHHVYEWNSMTLMQNLTCLNISLPSDAFLYTTIPIMNAHSMWCNIWSWRANCEKKNVSIQKLYFIVVEDWWSIKLNIYIHFSLKNWWQMAFSRKDIRKVEGGRWHWIEECNKNYSPYINSVWQLVSMKKWNIQQDHYSVRNQEFEGWFTVT